MMRSMKLSYLLQLLVNGIGLNWLRKWPRSSNPSMEEDSIRHSLCRCEQRIEQLTGAAFLPLHALAM